MLACKTLSEVFSVNRIFRRDDNGDNDHRDKNVNSDKNDNKDKNQWSFLTESHSPTCKRNLSTSDSGAHRESWIAVLYFSGTLLYYIYLFSGRWNVDNNLDGQLTIYQWGSCFFFVCFFVFLLNIMLWKLDNCNFKFKFFIGNMWWPLETRSLQFQLQVFDWTTCGRHWQLDNLGKTSIEKKTFSFGHCPNHLNPPPMTRIRATWSSFFGSRNSRFENQFRT